MPELLVGLISALWLGILTSISPCPLATNIAAISFVGRRVDSSAKVLLSGLLYTAGRALTYLVLGALLSASLLSAPYVSHLLQKYMNKLLGPVLIVVGMVLLELIRLSGTGKGVGEKTQKRVERAGVWGAFLLGMTFAAAFCPISAALFFGNVLASALKLKSVVLVPLVYGVGTGLPVVLFSVLIALGAEFVGRAFKRIATFELWARRFTGVLFIGIGIYFCLRHIFGVFS